MTKEVRKQLLYNLLTAAMSEKASLKQTVRERLVEKAKIYGLPPPQAQQTVDQILTVRSAIDFLLERIVEREESDTD